MASTQTIHIGTTEDAVSVIAAMATRVIAEGGHPGHDLEAVGRRLTSDTVLDAIRTAYNRRTTQGATPKEAVTAAGQSLVAHYCNSAGI